MGRSLRFLDDDVDMDMLEDNMTDPLMEKARQIISKYAINDDTYLSYQSKPLWVMKDIAQALQSHGEEVRGRTIEECASAIETLTMYIPGKGYADLAKAIRKLLEVE